MGYPLNDGQKRLLSQILGQDEQKLREGNYTLVFTSYSRARLDELLKHDNERMQIRAAGRKEGTWTRCPACDQPVLKKELLKRGCYLCGWQGTKEEIEALAIEDASQLAEVSTRDELERISSYKIDCPQCGARVIREQLIDNGCYLCGWKPK